MPSQTASGKGFEYAIASTIATDLSVPITGEARLAAIRAYEGLTEQEREERDSAARAAIGFLRVQDARIASHNVVSVAMQTDNAGQIGDVRDSVIATRDGTEIGISAKNRNRAIRNSRLSPHINFGENWFGTPCSEDYFLEITPVFDFLAPLERDRQRWRNLPNKDTVVYVPLLNAFITETKRIFGEHPEKSAEGMMRYMLGTEDYYKIFKQNGNVSIESFNMSGGLQWGNRLPMPSRLVDLQMKPNSKTTALMVLDSGWQLSFRIHNAESLVKRSLKFDIQIIGQPPQLSQHHIRYR